MQIAILTLSLSRLGGGLFFSVRSLSQHLQQLGADCRVIGPHDRFTDIDLAQWKPLDAVSYAVQGPQAFGFCNSIEQLVGEPDIQHMHGIWMYHSSVNHSFARHRNTPYLVSPRGMLDEWAIRNSWLKKKILGWLYEQKHLRDASCIHALCDAEAESIRRYGLTNPICVIPNGVSLPPQGTMEPRVTPTDSTRRKTMLFLGRIHPKKGLKELITAFSQVPLEERAGWEIQIAGWDQNHQQNLQDLARSCGLDSVIQFVGPQFGDAKHKLLQECEAFILPSFSEGLPMSVLEAWSYAKPTLITSACNLPEGVREKASLECESNVDSMREGLRTLFSMEAAATQSMGQRARRLVESKFTWSIVSDQMMEVYEWLLGRREAPDSVRFL